MGGQADQLELSPTLNALRFSYATPNFSNTIEYRYKLEGFDENWSSWSSKMEKEYTNLNSGDYKFSVRARFPYEEPGSIAEYVFSIRTPWYKTRTAHLFLLVFVGFLAYAWFRKTRQKFEEEKEIVELKNDKLQTEVNHQNEELASLTMHFVQKNEMLQKLKKELVQLNENSTEKLTKKNIKRLINLLDSDARLDEDWKRFAYYFDRVHSDFTKKLLAIHPQLTQKDLKTCVFLRMDLSTKEIAPLLNISIRGVEISRYRLRKKLGLESKQRLADYLYGI